MGPRSCHSPRLLIIPAIVQSWHGNGAPGPRLLLNITCGGGDPPVTYPLFLHLFAPRKNIDSGLFECIDCRRPLLTVHVRRGPEGILRLNTCSRNQSLNYWWWTKEQNTKTKLGCRVPDIHNMLEMYTSYLSWCIRVYKAPLKTTLHLICDFISPDWASAHPAI